MTSHGTGHRANVARDRHRSGLRHFIPSCAGAEIASKNSNRTGNSVPTARNGWPRSVRVVGTRCRLLARISARAADGEYPELVPEGYAMDGYSGHPL